MGSVRMRIWISYQKQKDGLTFLTHIHLSL